MAAPDPYAGTAEEFTAADWKEAVANFRPSGPNSFSQGGGEAALVGYVPAAKVRGALRFMLGYNNVAGTPKLIQRTNPICHPRYTNLICTSAAEEEFKPGGGGGVAALKTAANPLTLAATSIGNRAGYVQAKITARFQPIQWELAGDEGINRLFEYQRNTYIDVDPRIEFLSMDGFQLIYAEGAANTTGSNPVGKAFPAPFGQILAKPDIQVVWKHVPRRFVMLNNLPTNIVNGLGKVNGAAWNGYPAGTLLLVGARLVRTVWSLAAGSEELFNYDVTFLMSYFNPPKGKTLDATILTELGHNNMPWRGEVVAGDTNAGKWFLATRTGGNSVFPATDPRLLEYYDYDLLFRQAV